MYVLVSTTGRTTWYVIREPMSDVSCPVSRRNEIVLVSAAMQANLYDRGSTPCVGSVVERSYWSQGLSRPLPRGLI